MVTGIAAIFSTVGQVRSRAARKSASVSGVSSSSAIAFSASHSALIVAASPAYAASFECLEDDRADCAMQASGANRCTDGHENPRLRNIKSHLLITETTLKTCILGQCLDPIPVTTLEDAANKRTNLFGVSKTGVVTVVIIDQATRDFIETITMLGSHTTTKIGRCFRK